MNAAAELKQLIAVRPASHGDLAFIYSAWLESYGSGSPISINVWKSVYYIEQRKVINRLLRSDLVHHQMIVLADDPAVIVGFVIWQPEECVIHYCYVKHDFRRMGVMGDALDRLGIDPGKCQFTHLTYLMQQLRPKWAKLTYNPYLLAGD